MSARWVTSRDLLETLDRLLPHRSRRGPQLLLQLTQRLPAQLLHDLTRYRGLTAAPLLPLPDSQIPDGCHQTEHAGAGRP